MKKTRGILLAGFATLCLTACGTEEPDIGENNQTSESTESTYSPVFEEEHLKTEWDETAATFITFSGNEAKVDGKGAAAVDGGVKISEGGVYVLTGACSEGRVVANIEDEAKITLVLNNVSIHCSDSAALNIVNGDAHIILAENSDNVLSSGDAYQSAEKEDEEPNACIFGDDDLSVAGDGKLTVNAEFNNGIGSKNELRIAGGTIWVEAQNNALKGNECVLISGGDIEIISEDDGIKSDGKQDQISGVVDISGGDIHIVCKDDALQAVKRITASDCNLTVKAGGKKMNCDGVISVDESCIQNEG